MATTRQEAVTDRLVSSLSSGLPESSATEGDRFLVFGWTKTPLSLAAEEWARERGLAYLCQDYGPYGTVFLFSSHRDVVSTDEAILVKLGFARSSSLDPLYARDLLRQGLAGPRRIDYEDLHGNVVVVSVSQLEPAFCAYQGLTSTSQIYYWQDDGAIICSDSLRYLVAMVTPLELDPDAVPQHLLYRTVAGDKTYFKGVRKLLPGQMATYCEAKWRVQQVERLDDWVPERQTGRVSAQAVAAFDRKAEQIVGSYVQQVAESEHDLAVLLSGGVDSSLLASLMQSSLDSHHPLESISYAMRVPRFEVEVQYARLAVDSLGTEHRFVDVLPDDYPRLLVQLIDLTAQPVDNEQDPCYLALAQVLAGQEPSCLFAGSAVDTLLGNDDAKRLRQVERLRRIPGSSWALGFLGRALRGMWPDKAYGMRDAAHILQTLGDPTAPDYPMQRQSMFTNLERVQACFPPQVIGDALEYRLEVFSAYSSAPSVLEGMHLIELTHDVHDEEAALTQVYRAHDLEMINPFLDSQFVRAVLAFAPQIRFYAQGRPKWLAKQLLEDRLGSQTRITRQPKRAGGFDQELYRWMRDGVLKDLTHSIERPGYMNTADFEQALQQPDWFTWNLLTMDLFQKRFLNP